MAGEQRYELRISAGPRAVRLVRTFAGAVAIAAGLDPDTASDVKLAVSELASSAVSATQGTKLEFSAASGDGGLRIALRPWAETPRSEDDIDPWDVVTALFEDSILTGDEVSMRLPLASESGPR